MNKLILTALLCAVALSTIGQSRVVQDFQHKYDGEHDVTLIRLEGSLFKLVSMVAELGDEQDEDLRQLVNLTDGIDRMQIMNIDDYTDLMDQEDLGDLLSNLKKEGYDILVTAREGRKLVRILSQQSSRSVLKDVVILVEEGRNVSLVTIEGAIRLEDLDMFIDN